MIRSNIGGMRESWKRVLFAALFVAGCDAVKQPREDAGAAPASAPAPAPDKGGGGRTCGPFRVATVCVNGRTVGDERALDANTPLTVRVFPGCMGDGTGVVEKSSCSITLGEHNELTIETHTCVSRRGGDSVAAGCDDVKATCETPPLKPGKYEIGGREKLELVIPSQLDVSDLCAPKQSPQR